jgi:hypothetical protein
MPINSKKKGNSFERKIANFFSARFAEHTGKESSFRRNSDSGSYFGGTNQRRMETYDLDKAEFGDIICPKNFKFSLECKHYKSSPSFSAILIEDCKMFDTWIAEAEQDAKNSERLPCIVMKFNNVKESVMVKQPHGMKGVMKYRDYDIVTLETFVSQPTEWFFL